ncbi:hypothetical protein Pcinc_017955 [Petrolisthes cinctipes]|uniref:MADF domain-containing protein n=1 Tax=Petrolisthes cinctipes TaxID=88211 RepID=A0AAE1FN89_PETCI|nr:hypothetical protein Pcinc_017955 [Petrolisthes cinctipes]
MTEKNSSVGKKNDCRPLCVDTLIEKVKRYPHLYDISSIDYKDPKKCNTTWLAIANELGLPGEWKMCKERWRTLRDVYVRNKRGMSGPGGEGYTKRPKWKFFDQMDFLTAHVNHKPLKSEAEKQASHDRCSPRAELADGEARMSDDSDYFEGLKQEEELRHSTHDLDSDQPNTLVDGCPIKEEVEWADEEMEPITKPPSPPQEPTSPPKAQLKLDTKRAHQPDNIPPLKLRLNILNSATGEAMLGNKRIRLMLPGTVNHTPVSHTPVNHKPIQIRTKMACDILPKPQQGGTTTKNNTNSASSSNTNIIHITSNNTTSSINKTNLNTSNNNNTNSKDNNKSIIYRNTDQHPPHQQINRVPISLPRRETPAEKERSRTPKRTPSVPPVSSDNVAQETGKQNRASTSTSVSSRKDNEDEVYGRYITAALRKLSDRSRCLARVKIQQVLFYLQEADRGNNEYEHKLRSAFDDGVFE